VLAEVLQYVDERMTDLARRLEHPSVIPVRPHSTATTERPIDRLRDADRESLHATSELAVGFGLHEQVNVVVLHAELQ
jgi:hypothetical protein